MTLRPAYTLGHSEYNAFLFAVVDEGEAPLTVLSALSRLGLDPWQEAARLAALPREVAARSLAETIASLPRRESSASGSQAIAARLVNWLPTGSVPLIPPVPAEEKEASFMAQEKTSMSTLATLLSWAGIVVAAFILFVYLQGDNNLEPAKHGGGQTEQSIR
jgi:hypothetical protein